jgi:beta-glucuronidase
MIDRDKNRCSTIIWSMSNETYPSKERNEAITNLVKLCRSLDPARLITSAFVNVQYEGNTATLTDSLNKIMDVISINEYFGWYKPWPSASDNIVWISDFNKPLIMSEFGGEALYGNSAGPKDAASSWSEEYQEQIYKDQIKMLKKIPFLRGTCPWILADFRSPVRMHPVFQQGWNRKGLISDRGDKKKSWFIMKAFYDGR